jgi:uncharacterized protein (TIGR00369 family)
MAGSDGKTTAPSPGRRPFHDALGITVLEAKDGRSRVRMGEAPHLLNSRGDVHGGAIAGLLDVVLASAARSSLPAGYSAATVTYTTNFLLPARGTLIGEGQVLHSGRSIVSVEARVRDAKGVLVAQAVGTMRAIRPQGE